MKDFRWKIMGRLANNLFQFAYLYAQFREGIIPDWYVQDEKYFAKYKSEIINALSEGVGKFDYVAIHVRRGDYVNNPFYVDLFRSETDYDLGGSESKPNYYERAMALFPNEQFMVFSDDIAWCKQQSLFKDCLFSERHSEEEDINRMASCTKGVIMANSSFSWWGAYLNPHKCRIIAPKAWYADGIQRTGLPDSWERI